jgi:ribonuclease BN (tRNA processing enzyme)
MRLTVIGGCGAWPAAGQACSGYLVDHDGFRLLLDPGYAVTPLIDPATVDAVFVSHGHPDHCADLNPLLRARVLGTGGPLPVFSVPQALDPVLALDGAWVRDAARPHTVEPGTEFEIGPFTATTRLLPHHVPNVGIRLAAGGSTLAYTGDTGPSPEIARLADGVDLLLAEATYPDRVPDDADAPYLSTAEQAGRDAAAAGVRHLVLTHLWPGTDAAASTDAARAAYDGPVAVARPGLTIRNVSASTP